MTGLTECIARFVAGTGANDFPAQTTEKAKKAVADTFACIIAGAGSETAQPLLRYVERTGASGERPILGTHVRTSPELAAMVNGTFGHSLDFDDVLTMMPGHPSAIVLSALLASFGRDKTSGAKLLEAYVIGIEVGAKIGLGITNGHYNRGFHGTGTLGIFSAAAAPVKFHRLDANTIRTVLGIVSSTRPAGARGFVEVEVTTTDGRSEQIRVDAAPGHPKHELSWDDILQKFLDCAEHGSVDADRAERAFDALTRLERCDDVDAIARLLVLDR